MERELALKPRYGASCTKCLSGDNFEQCTGVFRHHENQHGATLIVQNPVKAGLVDNAEQYPYCYTYLAKKKAQGLKPRSLSVLYGPTKVVP
jgi:hypothetical protein